MNLSSAHSPKKFSLKPALAIIVCVPFRITPLELVENLKNHVVKEIGIIAKPEKIIISDSLPKTRSGKIMRRILRSWAAGEKISGDISTLEDSSVLEKLKEKS